MDGISEHSLVSSVKQKPGKSPRTSSWLPTADLLSNAWLQYDSKFCTLAAFNLHFHWAQCYPDLWLEGLALSNLDEQSLIL